LDAELVHELDVGFFAPFGQVWHSIRIGVAIFEAGFPVGGREEVDVDVYLARHLVGHASLMVVSLRMRKMVLLFVLRPCVSGP